MRIDVLTLFPDYLKPLQLSLVGKALAEGIVELGVHDPREHTTDRHRTVDDTPFGGGPGMVLMAEPWMAALEAVVAARSAPHQAASTLPPSSAAEQGAAPTPRLVVLTPSGTLLTQSVARRLATEPWLVLACGRYEGFDARFAEEAADHMPVEEVSVGDYVLAGGEAAALVLVEAVVRLLPGVLGNPSSLLEESHEDLLLEYPTYTRPRRWRGRSVPDVLLSGDHAGIARWRREASLRRTQQIRPDLLAPRVAGETDPQEG